MIVDNLLGRGADHLKISSAEEPIISTRPSPPWTGAPTSAISPPLHVLGLLGDAHSWSAYRDCGMIVGPGAVNNFHAKVINPGLPRNGSAVGRDYITTE